MGWPHDDPQALKRHVISAAKVASCEMQSSTQLAGAVGDAHVLVRPWGTPGRQAGSRLHAVLWTWHCVGSMMADASQLWHAGTGLSSIDTATSQMLCAGVTPPVLLLLPPVVDDD